MTTSLVFQICNILVLPQWILMIAAPNFHITRWLVKSKIIPILLGFVYIFFIINLFQIGSFASFGSLEGVKSLFGTDEILLAGWIHYLAFDLFVGSWEWQNAKTRHVPHFF